MEIFLTVKKNLASIDFIKNKTPFDEKKLWGSIESFSVLTLQVVHLIRVPNTAKEYMESAVMLLAGIGIQIAYFSMIAEYATIFEFIDEFERVINESE